MAAVSWGVLLGAIGLGVVHGIEPGHGWPVAASYALDRSNKWLAGFAAGLVIGVGHLVSSIAMVGVFFYAKSYFELTQVNEPIAIAEGVTIGGPVSVVAGVLLIVLGIREYRHGHSHGIDNGDRPGGYEHDVGEDHDHSHEHDHSHHHGHEHDHSHDHHHEHQHATDDAGVLRRLAGFLPFVGGHQHHSIEEGADRGILGIAWFAFLLGFAHEEEFEIIALCAGSTYCLELMTVYALTVIVGILALTLLLIAGYHRFEERVERFTPYLPAFSAAVLVVMGVGFVLGAF